MRKALQKFLPTEQRIHVLSVIIEQPVIVFEIKLAQKIFVGGNNVHTSVVIDVKEELMSVVKQITVPSEG